MKTRESLTIQFTKKNHVVSTIALKSYFWTRRGVNLFSTVHSEKNLLLFFF